MELENLIKIIETVSASELTGLKYEENGIKLHLTKKKDQVQVVAAPAQMQASPEIRHLVSEIPAEETEKEEQNSEGKVIKSPLVGTFYAAPAEDAEPFVTVGDTVKKGQTLAIIEAMKLMNEIESEYDGTISEILVTNGQPVEYGQPIFRIR